MIVFSLCICKKGCDKQANKIFLSHLLHAYLIFDFPEGANLLSVEEKDIINQLVKMFGPVI